MWGQTSTSWKLLATLEACLPPSHVQEGAVVSTRGDSGGFI